IDIAHALPGENKAIIRARVVMSPLSAKLFYKALGENISRYESAFGEINMPVNSTLADQLFRPHQPPEHPTDKKE
ncbi:MAG: DUF3467 domain-containing protein, partial [Chloroflexota bacterium]